MSMAYIKEVIKLSQEAIPDLGLWVVKGKIKMKERIASVIGGGNQKGE